MTEDPFVGEKETFTPSRKPKSLSTNSVSTRSHLLVSALLEAQDIFGLDFDPTELEQMAEEEVDEEDEDEDEARREERGDERIDDVGFPL